MLVRPMAFELTSPVTLREGLRLLADLVGGASARREAALLWFGLSGWSRSLEFSDPDRRLPLEPWRQALELARRRARGEPLAYLLGQQEFWSLPLEVGPEVLIPRADTECLVEQALLRLPAQASDLVVDLGTGSGAIALALAVERPQLRLIGVDRSPRALARARANGERLAPGRVDWRLGDWLQPVPERGLAMVVSNPPYIAAGDPHLDRGDLRFEPREALVSGLDGLDDLGRIIAQAREALMPGGWLLLEHGWQQGPAVRELLARAGYADPFTVRDLAGQPRVSGGRKA